MKIYFNGRFLTQKITGVQRYALEMVRAIDYHIGNDDALKKHEWLILAPNTISHCPSLKYIKIKEVGILHGHLWEQLELPLYSVGGFLINFCNCAPLIKRNQVVTIHDAAVAAFPDAFSYAFRTWYRIMYTLLGKRLHKIFTVSNFSKNELHKYFNIPLNKMVVAYSGIDHILKIIPDENIISKLSICDTKYVLAVSSLSSSKNFKLVLEAASKMPETQFIIAGGSNKNLLSNDNLAVPSNAKFIGYVTDEELMALYEHAACFVYPSLYEGFGLPPLEAMCFGCQVIVSKCASLPEIFGEMASYCDAYDANDLVEMISRILSKEIMNKNYIDVIKEKYSWVNSAKILLDNITLR